MNVLFCALEVLRSELSDEFYDSVDCDDYIFSLLDLEAAEVELIYDGVTCPYTGSTFVNGESPKDWHLQYRKAIQRGVRAKEPLMASQREGLCPVCGAVLQTFDATEDSYGVMYIPWLCNHCHNSGRSRFEHSGWNFVEHELDAKEE